MKKTFLLSAFFLCLSSISMKLSAQGNLQFNQVIFYDIPYGTTQAFSVPVGKVWKIESVGASMSSCGVTLQNSSAQNIGYLYYVSSSIFQPSYPIWFPASHAGFFAYNVNNCTGARAFVSIIEFNVVP